MKNIINIINNNGSLVVTSRQIAEDFGKEHFNIVRDIENLIKSIAKIEDTPKYFIESQYQHEQNKQWYKEYLLTRDGFSLLVMGFTGSKALEWKMKYIEAFNKMEQKLKPTSIEDLIIMQAQNMKNIREKMNKVESQTQLLSNRVSNLDCIDIEGTPRQRLNAMVKKYKFDKAIDFSKAWEDFIRSYNTAFHTNLKFKIQSYSKKNNLKKKISTLDYLEKMELIEDALRVADKMLNERVA